MEKCLLGALGEELLLDSGMDWNMAIILHYLQASSTALWQLPLVHTKCCKNIKQYLKHQIVSYTASKSVRVMLRLVVPNLFN